MTTSQSRGPHQDPRYISHILWINLFLIWFSVSHPVSRCDACICFLAGLAELNLVCWALLQSPQQNGLRRCILVYLFQVFFQFWGPQIKSWKWWSQLQENFGAGNILICRKGIDIFIYLAYQSEGSWLWNKANRERICLRQLFSAQTCEGSWEQKMEARQTGNGSKTQQSNEL